MVLPCLPKTLKSLVTWGSSQAIVNCSDQKATPVSLGALPCCRAIYHFEGFGTKFDRAAAHQSLDKVQQESAVKKDLQGNILPFDPQLAESALARAEAVSSALLGARLLWVDQHPENNASLVAFFQDIGIRVQLALNSQDGITFAKMDAPSRDQIFDLVISNQYRHDEKVRPPLQKCPAILCISG
jgi:hypothetical protein